MDGEQAVCRCGAVAHALYSGKCEDCWVSARSPSYDEFFDNKRRTKPRGAAQTPIPSLNDLLREP